VRAYTIAAMSLEEDGGEFGAGMGSQEHDFLYRYVAYLAEQDLARVDFDAYQRDWDHGLQGSFRSPLTQRGQELVTFLSNHERKVDGPPAIQDKPFHGPREIDIALRTPAVRHLKERIANPM